MPLAYMRMARRRGVLSGEQRIGTNHEQDIDRDVLKLHPDSIYSCSYHAIANCPSGLRPCNNLSEPILLSSTIRVKYRQRDPPPQAGPDKWKARLQSRSSVSELRELHDSPTVLQHNRIFAECPGRGRREVPPGLPLGTFKVGFRRRFRRCFRFCFRFSAVTAGASDSKVRYKPSR
jgi:hypothetical protein